MRYYLHKQKLINILILPKSFFYTWVNISFNFRARKNYYIPDYCKLYEESAEFYHFALATLDPELQPRKPVHFSMWQTLICLQLILPSKLEYQWPANYLWALEAFLIYFPHVPKMCRQISQIESHAINTNLVIKQGIKLKVCTTNVCAWLSNHTVELGISIASPCLELLLTYFLQFFLMSLKCVVKSVRSNRTPWIQIACWKKGIKGSGCKCTAPCKQSWVESFSLKHWLFAGLFPKRFKNYYSYNKLRSSPDLKYMSQISSAPSQPTISYQILHAFFSCLNSID